MKTDSRITVPVLLGPTAAGKSAVALSLADRHGCTIISCDSRQIYRGMDIGTAKETLEERTRVPHRLVDILDPGESYSISQFVQDAENAIRECAAQGSTPFLVGGTGLYFESLRRGVGPQIASDPELRARLMERAASEGSGRLHRELQEADPEAAAKIHPNDTQRIVRALAVFLQTGEKISRLQQLTAPSSEFMFRIAVMQPPREALYERINARVDAMIASGLWEEFMGLRSQGYDERAPGLKCLGYQELFAVEKGECSLPSAGEMIKLNSRRFAKRQMTWFRNHNGDSIIECRDEDDFPVEKIADALGFFG